VHRLLHTLITTGLPASCFAAYIEPSILFLYQALSQDQDLYHTLLNSPEIQCFFPTLNRISSERISKEISMAIIFVTADHPNRSPGILSRFLKNSANIDLLPGKEWFNSSGENV
jgi:hypothetical protein